MRNFPSSGDYSFRCHIIKCSYGYRYIPFYTRWNFITFMYSVIYSFQCVNKVFIFPLWRNDLRQTTNRYKHLFVIVNILIFQVIYIFLGQNESQAREYFTNILKCNIRQNLENSAPPTLYYITYNKAALCDFFSVNKVLCTAIRHCRLLYGLLGLVGCFDSTAYLLLSLLNRKK